MLVCDVLHDLVLVGVVRAHTGVLVQLALEDSPADGERRQYGLDWRVSGVVDLVRCALLNTTGLCSVHCVVTTVGCGCDVLDEC